VAEHSYLLNIKPLKTVTVTGAYDKERFKDYFTFSNLRSVFNPDVGDKLEKYGGSVAWTIAKPLEITADYRHYKRDTLGNSDRLGGEFRLNLLDNKVRAGLSYHRSDGASGINSYDEVRGFGMYRGDKFFGDLDAIIQIYDHPIHTKHNAFEVIATAGYRIIPELALSGDISYGENPQYTSETRGVVRLTYNFNSASKGANK
jgi:hypothetical protein